MSLAQPITTVTMPLASRWRATRLEVWWQTGQFGTRIAAVDAVGEAAREDFRRVDVHGVAWLRLVGTPKKRGATAPMRPAASGLQELRKRKPGADFGRRGVLAVIADMRDAQIVLLGGIAS